MTREEVCALIEETAIIPAVRVSTAADALFAANAIFESGIRVVELTMTVTGAMGVISDLARTQPQLVVGAGTVLDIDTARRCLDAGISFLTSPGLDSEIVDFGVKHKIAVIPGALTPTEVMLANKAGADFVKVFPCSQLGGPSYIKALKAPFPHVRMIASGGVNQKTAADFLYAGAVALGIGGDLIPGDAIRSRNKDWIRELTSRFLNIVRNGRAAQYRKQERPA